MKPIQFTKFLAQCSSLHSFRVALAAPALLLTFATAQAGSPAAPTAPAEEVPLSNWIGFTIGGAFVNGDDAAMRQRTHTNGDFYGGIDSLQFSKAVNDSTTLTLDGHALPGLEDYEFNINIEKTDVGYIKAGYKEFRTWYDASGGYLEGANMIGVGNQFNDEQSIDRGEIYFEAGLRMEKLPEITFSYRHLWRNGQKDSTCWGDTQSNAGWGGAPGTQNFAFKLMPALWDIDESTDIFELDVEHTLGNTDIGMGLVFESYNLDNSRYTPRWGNQPKVNGGSTTKADTMIGVNETNLTEKTDADIFASHIHSVTRFNDKAWLSFAASYSNMDTDIGGGSRTWGKYWANPVPPAVTGDSNKPTIRDYAYDQMSGGSSVNQFIANLNFMWVPVQDLTVTPSLRYENESIDTFSKFRAFNTNQTWQGLESLAAYTDKDSTTGALDLRYTGFSDIVLFAKGQWGRENEDVLRKDRYMTDGTGVPDADLDGEFLSSDIQIDEQEYVLGANWYARSNLSFALQGIHSERDQSLDHYEGNEQYASAQYPLPGGANNFRPIMTEHNVEIDDLSVRMTWRPMSNLSLVTRYDYRHTEIENRGINWSKNAAPTTTSPNIDPAVIYPTVESGDIASHIVSQSVTWSPTARFYLQGNASWIRSETKTPETYTGNSDSDYFMGSLTAGYAIDDRTDITASYTYYGASNYANSTNYYGANTMGYGLNTEEHAVSLTLTRLLTPSMIWNLRYAYITSNTDPMPDQSGGYNDFDAHMISTGLQIRF